MRKTSRCGKEAELPGVWSLRWKCCSWSRFFDLFWDLSKKKHCTLVLIDEYLLMLAMWDHYPSLSYDYDSSSFHLTPAFNSVGVMWPRRQRWRGGGFVPKKLNTVVNYKHTSVHEIIHIHFNHKTEYVQHHQTGTSKPWPALSLQQGRKTPLMLLIPCWGDKWLLQQAAMAMADKIQFTQGGLLVCINERTERHVKHVMSISKVIESLCLHREGCRCRTKFPTRTNEGGPL